MKLLHLADIHIGMENYGRTDSATGLNTRLIDYLERFDEALQIGLEQQVDLVLIAGDIYKNRSPNPTHQREFARRLRTVLRENIPVFMLVGNHDVSTAAGKAHSVEIFDTLAVEGVTIASKMQLHAIETRAGALQIAAVPWINRHAILTKDDYRNLPFAELDAELLRRVGAWLDSLPQRIDPQLPAVIAFHGSISSAAYGSERSVMLGHDLVIPPSFLAQEGVQYVALGHIHRHQAFGTHPPLVYPGSLERIDFSEEKEEKGVVIVEIDKLDEPATWRFVPVHPRPFRTVKVNVAEVADPMEQIHSAINKRDLSGAVVRIIISALNEQRVLIDEVAIRRWLEEQDVATIASVHIDVERSQRSRYAAVADEFHDGMTPRRALELYLQAQKMSNTRRERLLATAETLIRNQQEQNTR